ncbi:MAG: O-antigen ligase family protein [Deltaproteobacteria bacterium]|nr:O-antigen ligase family protein [Deltaproteobacteria bacterium]
MFAIPGICALIVFILARPQEFFTLLQRVPFLHLFTVLAVLGWVVDIRLRRLQPIAAPSLPWVVALFLWALVCVATKAPAGLIGRTVELAILFAIYGTIAHGIQRFRTFQAVAGVLVASCLFISVLCFHEGMSPTQCVGGVEGEGGVEGTPDGRECDNKLQCLLGPEAEPGLDYRCEHVGAFGMYSVEGRVRYIGELHDPNEVALVISTGALSMLIGFMLRKRGVGAQLALAAGVVLVVWTVLMTQSRGGLIVALMVPGVYVIRRYGLISLIPAGLLALPVLMLTGRSGESADMSTQLRYEAWAAGLQMFRQSPLLGTGGPKTFTDHHFIAAHNSYVLTLAEMGLPGLFLFVTVIYLSIKTVIVGLRELRDVPGTNAAQVWGMALLASLFGAVFQINTLSFAYHSALWILIGLSGAWFSCVRNHRPEFKVGITWRDFFIIVTFVVAYAFLLLPLLLRSKGH